MSDFRARIDRGDIEAGIQEMHAEGQGVWTLEIYYPEDVLRAAVAARAGDQRARRALRSLGAAHKSLPVERPLCLLCDDRCTKARVGAWALVSAHREDPSRVILSPVCWGCAADRETLLDRAFQKYKTSMIPDLRILTPSAPGRA